MVRNDWIVWELENSLCRVIRQYAVLRFCRCSRQTECTLNEPVLYNHDLYIQLPDYPFEGLIEINHGAKASKESVSSHFSGASVTRDRDSQRLAEDSVVGQEKWGR